MPIENKPLAYTVHNVVVEGSGAEGEGGSSSSSGSGAREEVEVLLDNESLVEPCIRRDDKGVALPTAMVFRAGPVSEYAVSLSVW